MKITRVVAACLIAASACASPTTDTSDHERERPDPIAAEPDDAPLDPPELGIASCDRYIAAFAACIERSAPAASKPALRKALRDTIEAWRGLTHDPPSRAHVEHICHDAYVAAATLTKQWGCDLPPESRYG